MRWSWIGAVTLGITLAGCATGPKAVVTVAPVAPVEQPTGWRGAPAAHRHARVDAVAHPMQRARAGGAGVGAALWASTATRRRRGDPAHRAVPLADGARQE